MAQPEPAITTLSNGAKMPSLGLGLWKVPKDVCAALVVSALKAGWRHLDCACDYGNEAEVGAGISTAIEAGVCKREEIWVTSKLWNTYHAKEHVPLACDRTLKDLQLDYVDLYLIHFPIAQKFVPFETRYPPEWVHDPEGDDPKMELADISIRETWEAMEALVQAGKAKNIGICNFTVQTLREMKCYAKIMPVVNQVELHPYLTQQWLVQYCNSIGITMTGFSPFGGSSYVEIGMATEDEFVLKNSCVLDIAAKHGKTAGQVVLRWGVQHHGTIVCKTSKEERLVENMSIFDFELSAEEMESITALNKYKRFNDPGQFCQGMNSFCPIYDN